MLNELAYAQGVDDGMAKFAISKFRQYARDATQAASKSQDPAAAAKARAVTQQAYKPRVLGTGQEGTATLHMMPQAAEGGALTPTVRKVFDPKAGLASPELIQRRIALGTDLGETGSFAKHYGYGTTKASPTSTQPGGRQYIDTSFVPGKSLAPGSPELRKAQAGIDRDLRSTGMRMGAGHLTAKDLHSENIRIDPRTKKPVALDYMPMKRQETYDPRYNRLANAHNPAAKTDPTAPLPTHAGSLLFPNRGKEWSDPSGTMQQGAEKMMAGQMVNNPQAVLPPKPGQAPAAPTASPGFVPQAAPPGVHVPGESVFGSLNMGGTQPGVMPQLGTQAGVMPQSLPLLVPPR